MTGLIIMAAFTAMAAAAFGILIASLCRTRGQLDGMSTVVILIMSALGGSMVPRFVMPDFMKEVGLFTFNGQALEGFLSVFWESNPTDSLADLFRDLAPQLLIMGLMTAILFSLARFFARRWEMT
jgi:ABC-2 type transport system permease protein